MYFRKNIYILKLHLGYEKHQAKKSGNTRNGFSAKTVATPDGQLNLEIPCDRDGSCEPQIIKSIKRALPAWMIKFYLYMLKE